MDAVTVGSWSIYTLKKFKCSARICLRILAAKCFENVDEISLKWRSRRRTLQFVSSGSVFI